MGALRNFLNRLLGTSAAVTVAPEPPRAAMRVSAVALAEASSAYGAPLDPWKLPPAPSWFDGDRGAQMALDAAGGGGIGDLYAWAVQGAFSEGLGFLGYPYLAELSQRPEYRRVSEIWAAEATRKWVDFKGDPKRIDEIEKAIEHFKLRDRFRQLAEKDGFFGRAQLFIDLGHDPASPELKKPLIAKAKVRKGSIKNFKIIEPFWSYPGLYQSANPLASDFYKPKYWYVMASEVHSSRLLTITGREMPDMLKPAYSFGGLSLSQMVKPYVDNWLRTRQSISDLLHSFSTMVLATDMGGVLANGSSTGLIGRLDLFTRTRDNRGVMAINKETEELTNVSTPLGTLDALQSQSQEQIASVSGIPLVILLGVTPSGLNASSDGEIRTFYATIKAYQERVFRDPLAKVIELLQYHLFGDVDPEITFEFVDLWELPEQDKATVRKSDADVDVAYVGAGIVSNEEVRSRIIQDPDSPYFGMELDPEDVPELPEQEEDPFGGDDDDPSDPPGGQAQDADWKEDKHPRRDDGKFGSGGGGASKPKVKGKSTASGAFTAYKNRDGDKGAVHNATGMLVGQFSHISVKSAKHIIEALEEIEAAMGPEKMAALARGDEGAVRAFRDGMRGAFVHGAWAPSGSPLPDEWASAPAAKPPHPKVAAILGDKGIDRVRELIADKNSKSADILAALKPLDDAQREMTPTLPHDKEPDAAFWASRTYADGMDARAARDHLTKVAAAYASKDGGVGVKRDKQARILLGPPAAGKSTSAERIAATEGYAIVDGDDAKKVIPEFDDGVGASAVHEESSHLSQRVLNDMLDRGDNVILPLVGGSPGSIEKRIEVLKAAGYSVTVDLVDVAEDEAARRMASRALRTGRHISSSYFANIGDGPKRTYEHLKASHEDVGFGRIDGNGGPRDEQYTEAVNHPTAQNGYRLFGSKG